MLTVIDLASYHSLQMVDTKSLHNTTLLHFLERTVAKHFPDMEAFLDELLKLVLVPEPDPRGDCVERWCLRPKVSVACAS